MESSAIPLQLLMGVVSDCYYYVVYQQQQETKVVITQAIDVTRSILCMLQAMPVPCIKKNFRRNTQESISY